MSLKVKTRATGLAVILYKNVGRTRVSGDGPKVSTRYSGQQSVLDVTRYIGEQGSVRVEKSVRAPNGTFTIDFVDKLVQVADDSLYGLLEPMDIVEIRMAANAYQYKSSGGPGTQVSFSVGDETFTSATPPPSHLPIMMRGFISFVSRSQGIRSDGKPTRKVTISGEDYGKIWQMYHIYYNPWMPNANLPGSGNYIGAFKLFQQFGIGFSNVSAGKFVQQVLDKILNPFINQMQSNANTAVPTGNSPITTLTADIQTQGGTIGPFGTYNWTGGSLYELLMQYMDVGEWNELYIEDRDEKGPYLVYRPNPFLKAGGDPSKAGDYINQNDSSAIVVNTISASDIFRLDVCRSDRHVANYFWVESPQYDLSYDFLGKALATHGGRATFVLDTYGFKRMQATTAQNSPMASAGNGTPKPQNEKDASNTLQWIAQRRMSLMASNQDNVVFENGTMSIVGNEKVRAGTYLMVNHGNMTSAYYVVCVTHNYVPFGQYTTMVTFERGTGFIDRVQRGGGAASPYLSELADSQGS